MFLLYLLHLISCLSTRRSIQDITQHLICDLSLSYRWNKCGNEKHRERGETETGDLVRCELTAWHSKTRMKKRVGGRKRPQKKSRLDERGGGQRGYRFVQAARQYKRRAHGTQKLLVGERRGIIDCEHRHPAQPITELHTDFSGLEHLHLGRGVKWTKEQWWKRGRKKNRLWRWDGERSRQPKIGGVQIFQRAALMEWPWDDKERFTPNLRCTRSREITITHDRAVIHDAFEMNLSHFGLFDAQMYPKGFIQKHLSSKCTTEKVATGWHFCNLFISAWWRSKGLQHSF